MSARNAGQHLGVLVLWQATNPCLATPVWFWTGSGLGYVSQPRLWSEMESCQSLVCVIASGPAHVRCAIFPNLAHSRKIDADGKRGPRDWGTCPMGPIFSSFVVFFSNNKCNDCNPSTLARRPRHFFLSKEGVWTDERVRLNLEVAHSTGRECFPSARVLFVNSLCISIGQTTRTCITFLNVFTAQAAARNGLLHGFIS